MKNLLILFFILFGFSAHAQDVTITVIHQFDFLGKPSKFTSEREIKMCNEMTCTYTSPQLFFEYKPGDSWLESSQVACDYRNKFFSFDIKEGRVAGRYLFDEEKQCERDIIIERVLASDKGQKILAWMDTEFAKKKEQKPTSQTVELFK